MNLSKHIDIHQAVTNINLKELEDRLTEVASKKYSVIIIDQCQAKLILDSWKLLRIELGRIQGMLPAQSFEEFCLRVHALHKDSQ